MAHQTLQVYNTNNTWTNSERTKARADNRVDRPAS